MPAVSIPQIKGTSLPFVNTLAGKLSTQGIGPAMMNPLPIRITFIANVSITFVTGSIEDLTINIESIKG